MRSLITYLGFEYEVSEDVLMTGSLVWPQPLVVSSLQAAGSIQSGDSDVQRRDLRIFLKGEEPSLLFWTKGYITLRDPAVNNVHFIEQSFIFDT